MKINNNGGLKNLPEDCVSNILSLTTPRDVCLLSLVSSTFRSAAESDYVWDKFLPADYRELLDRSDVDGDHSSSPMRLEMKKQVYMCLCDEPLLIDEGRMLLFGKMEWKKCYMIAARDLTIAWGDTPSYWTWISLPDSRFAQVAELRHVCWLEIRGKINTHMLSDATNYAAYMVFMFTSNAHGFQHQPVEVSINTPGVETSVRTMYLDPNGEQPPECHILPRRMGLFSPSVRTMFIIIVINREQRLLNKVGLLPGLLCPFGGSHSPCGWPVSRDSTSGPLSSRLEIPLRITSYDGGDCRFVLKL